MDTRFMDSLGSFKAYMQSGSAPNYVRRYCSLLEGSQWTRFYAQMMDGMLSTDNPEYLFYALKWILKHDFRDMAYEMYCYDMMDPGCRAGRLVKDSLWDAYTYCYFQRFLKDYGPGCQGDISL